MKWIKGGLAVLLLLVVLAGGFLVPTIWGKPWSIEHFYMRYLVRSMLPYPMLLTATGVLRPMGLTFYEDDLGDFSVEATEKQIAYQDSEREVLRSYDREALDAAGQLSYDTMEFWIEAGLIRVPEPYLLHEYAIQHLSAVHVEIADFMVSSHRFDDARYAKWYVDRISKFGDAVDQQLDRARRQADKGIIPPRFILERTRNDCLTFTSSTGADHPLYTHFEKKTEDLEGLSEHQREELSDRLRETIDSVVIPAWHRIIATIDELLPTSSDDAGVWKLPDGQAYYAFKLFQITTTKMTADEIHQLGRRKVAELRQEMLAILGQEGYPVDQPVGRTLRGLLDEERFQHDDSEEGRQAVLAEYQRIIDEIAAGMSELFDLKPPVGVEVKAVPDFKEDSAPMGYYSGPPVDFSKPGEFYANLGTLDQQTTIGMRTLAYHEAIPGHHFQIAISLSLEDLPMARRLLPFIAYVEGWALYAERLAAEHGYQDDPFDRLGYLEAQMFRAVRLVVDTGLHSKRWTREQAVEFMLENLGAPREEIEIEVDRYVVWPGQATAYMTGQLKILELRERMKEKLGDEFSLKEFHNRVLGNGALPLFLLERVVLEP
jgi:uncharacterized protein (DUF885 family)